MGRSETINVIGFSAEEKLENGNYRRYECHAMNKMQMAQKRKIMKEKGTPVTGWFAQTQKGCQLLGKDVFIWEEVPDIKVKHTKLVKCPICNGMGKMPLAGKDFYNSCAVCNGSGITRKNHWNKWRPWQIEMMKKEFAV